MAACGRFCCKSRKMTGPKNRRETRRDKKVLFKGVVTRLRKPLVERGSDWVVPHAFFRWAFPRPWEI
jgi:hypothetical protein